MLSTNSTLTSRFSIIVLPIKLFTIGIHSSEQGPKAWFEMFAVTATLMACGYLAWYQGIFIILALIFGGIAAGMFVFLAPAYTIQNNIATKPAINTLKTISRIKTQRVNYLTQNKLVDEKNCQIKAFNKLTKKFSKAIEEYPELGEIFETIRQGATEASNKADIEKQEHIYREQEEQKQQEEHERTLNELRAIAGEPSGHPPDPNNPKYPPRGYPIKVTKNLTKEQHKGIYYRPDDYDYLDYDAAWWFESESHVPKHKYRRPHRKGKGRGFRE